MRVVTLAENTAISPDYRAEHGLSLYIETQRHKLLFDLGAGDLFAENAGKLRVDIASVDTVILSHGHRDHGGGLARFLSKNSAAKVYARAGAFDPHFSSVLGAKVPIGLDPALAEHAQVVLVTGDLVIDEDLRLFSDPPGDSFLPSGNSRLYRREGEQYVRDDFAHEQSLIVQEGSTSCLFSGCAHRGALNILEKAERLLGESPDYFVGGFHLHNPPLGPSDSAATVRALASELAKRRTSYYTCHCTGERGFRQLRHVLRDQLHSISTGGTILL